MEDPFQTGHRADIINMEQNQETRNTTSKVYRARIKVEAMKGL